MKGGPQPRVSSPLPGLLDLQTSAPEVAKHHCAVRPGQRAGQVDHLHPVEGPAMLCSPALQSAAPGRPSFVVRAGVSLPACALATAGPTRSLQGIDGLSQFHLGRPWLVPRPP